MIFSKILSFVENLISNIKQQKIGSNEYKINWRFEQ